MITTKKPGFMSGFFLPKSKFQTLEKYRMENNSYLCQNLKRDSSLKQIKNEKDIYPSCRPHSIGW